MKILQVIHSFPPYNTAGSEVYTYNLSQELSKRHWVFVFHRINNLHMKEYTLTYNKLDNLEIFRINNTFRLYNSFEMTYKNDAIAEKFSLVLDQVKPDIVHVQHLLYLSTKIIEEVKKRKIPVVFTIADYWLICPQGQLLSNNWVACDGENNSECINCILHQLSIKKSVFSTYYFLKRSVPESLLQFAKNTYLGCCRFLFLTKNKALDLIDERISYMKGICPKVDLFISPSKFLRRKFIEFGIPKDKIIFLPYGFKLANFKDSQKIYSCRLRFGFIGNLIPAKGIHILIESFNKIKNNNAELRIYGQDMSYKGILGNYFHRIKKMVKNKNIKFMGGFDNRNVVEIFREIDVLVVPSIWYENSPLVIQEALASKTPVIASNIGGILELVKDRENGLLFNTNDVIDLYEKISLILDNPKLMEDLRKNTRFPKSINVNAREIENIYADLLANAKNN